MTRLMSIPDVLAIIPVKEVTLRRYVRQNKVEFVKIGRRIFFQEETIDDLITKNTVRAKQGLRPE